MKVKYVEPNRRAKNISYSTDMIPHITMGKYLVCEKVRILVDKYGEEILCDDDAISLIFDDRNLKATEIERAYFEKMLADGIAGWMIDSDSWNADCLKEMEDYIAENQLSKKKAMHIIAVIGNAIKLDGIEDMPDFQEHLNYICR